MEFYLDSLAVLEGTFALDDDSLYIAITGELTPEPGRGLIKIWGFSSKAGYLAWADAHNLPAARNLAIEEHLRNYADTSGAVSIYDSTGAIPQWYIDYEISYLKKMGILDERSIEDRSLCWLRKGCNHTGGVPMLTTLPLMWPGWNDAVSRFDHLVIYGNVKLYSKRFYKRRFFDYWNWGYQEICFRGPLAYANNRMRSGFCF